MNHYKKRPGRREKRMKDFEQVRILLAKRQRVHHSNYGGGRKDLYRRDLKRRSRWEETPEQRREGIESNIVYRMASLLDFL